MQDRAMQEDPVEKGCREGELKTILTVISKVST